MDMVVPGARPAPALIGEGARIASAMIRRGKCERRKRVSEENGSGLIAVAVMLPSVERPRQTLLLPPEGKRRLFRRR